MTTRSKLVVMLESQQQTQEELLQRSDDLTQQQQAYDDRLTKVDRLEEHVWGLVTTIEECLRA